MPHSDLTTWATSLSLEQAEEILGPGLVASLRASSPDHCSGLAWYIDGEALKRGRRYPSTSRESVAKMRRRRDAYAVIWLHMTQQEKT